MPTCPRSVLFAGNLKLFSLSTFPFFRLNWASGANSDVMSILSTFETAVKLKERRLELEHKTMALVHKTCSSILQHELIRTQTAESEALDKRFLSALAGWKNACDYISRKNELVTATEEKMMKLHVSDWRNSDISWASSTNVFFS